VKYLRLTPALILVSVIVGSLLASSTGSAQDSELLEIQLIRTFGFQAGLQVQGSFSARIFGPEDISSVRLYLDGETIGTAKQAPFRVDFNTGDFAAGEHRLWAEAVTGSGDLLCSAERRLIFLTAEEGLGSVSNYLFPIFILIAVGIVFSYLLLMRSAKSERFRVGEYGVAGGAVCRRCALPFSRHFFAPNLVVGKLERCPHCGHWAIVPRAAVSELKAAEGRYESDRDQGAYEPDGADDEWQRRIEDTRFED